MIDKNLITVGQLAKQANVSVRTLQYYDKIDLLKPSTVSEGGRRLYSRNDITTLHQIMTLKSLGFSLEDIKHRLMPVHCAQDVVHVLNKQVDIIKEQIAKAQRILESVEMLTEEIKDTQHVDWYKYSNMVKLIGENNEYYWVMKHVDEDLLTSMIHQHETRGEEGSSIEWWQNCFRKALELQSKGILPESDEAQKLAGDWWQFMLTFSKGDMHLLGKLIKFYKSADEWPEEFRNMQKQIELFMEETIQIYVEKNNLTLLKDFI